MRIINDDTIYQLTDVLSKNSGSEVWLGTMQSGDSQPISCLIKLITVPISSNDKGISNEASLLQAISTSPDTHQTFVKYHHSFFHEKDGKKYFIIVLDNTNQPLLLNTFRENDVANYYDFMRAAKSIAKAICYLHLSGITHGNICPDNIIYKSDSGEVILLDKEPGCSLISHLHNTDDSNLAYKPLDILELDSLPSFYQRTRHDTWSYGLCMFRIANGFDMIPVQNTGAVIRAINNKSYRKSRHPNEKVNEFLQFILQDNPNDRPSIIEILAYLEYSNNISILDISRHSHNQTIVQRVLRNMNITTKYDDNLEKSAIKIITHLHQNLPITSNKYSSDYVYMLAEFFGVDNAEKYDPEVLCVNINNRVIAARDILRLRNTTRVVKMLIGLADMRFKTGHTENVKNVRRQVVEIIDAMQQESMISSGALRTGWAIESDRLHGHARVYDYTNGIVESLLKML